MTALSNTSQKVSSRNIKRKVLLLGDGAVGKTSLIRKFVLDKFDDKYIATIGTKVTKKELELDNNGETIYLTLMIWDVLGQRGYTKIQATSFLGAQGVIFVCDFTRMDTLMSIEEYWLPTVSNSLPGFQMVFVANKSDLAHDAQFSYEDLQNVASKYNTVAFPCSAKTGENVEELFFTLGSMVTNIESEAVSKEPAVVEEKSKETTLVAATDLVINDFCNVFGDMDRAMPVVRQQFIRAGVDIRNPTKEGVLKVIGLLADVERDYLDRLVVRKNRTRRRLWVEQVKA
ncbi:MAG: GTP-binding protein [Thermoplasmata archaeon]|nr:MAG: GTP-binding protein [Thermoplasmata archaeon]